MEINTTNTFRDKIDFFFPNLSINQNSDNEDYKIYDGFKFLDTESKFYNSSLNLINPSIKKNFDSLNHIDINQISNMNSKDKSIDSKKNLLKKKRNNSNEKKEMIKTKRDNLLRKAKRIALASLLKYDNDMISKIYNYNIGEGIHKKELYINGHFQIKCSSTSFNKELLKKPQGEILSENITSKFTNIPPDHNKTIINQLKNEKDEEKKELFDKLFNITLLECINHLSGKSHCKELEGIEEIYENLIFNLKGSEEYKEKLRNIFNEYERIYNEKKPRKRKTKKSNKSKK